MNETKQRHNFLQFLRHCMPSMVTRPFIIPSTQEGQLFFSLRPTKSIERVPHQPEPHSESLSKIQVLIQVLCMRTCAHACVQKSGALKGVGSLVGLGIEPVRAGCGAFIAEAVSPVYRFGGFDFCFTCLFLYCVCRCFASFTRIYTCALHIRLSLETGVMESCKLPYG